MSRAHKHQRTTSATQTQAREVVARAAVDTVRELHGDKDADTQLELIAVTLRLLVKEPEGKTQIAAVGCLNKREAWRDLLAVHKRLAQLDLVPDRHKPEMPRDSGA